MAGRHACLCGRVHTSMCGDWARIARLRRVWRDKQRPAHRAERRRPVPIFGPEWHRLGLDRWRWGL